MTTVFTTLYPAADSRTEELRFVMQQHLENPAVDRIAVLCEGDPTALLERFGLTGAVKPVKTFTTEYRASYDQYFNLSRDHFPGDLVVVCNTDIFFDDTLALLQTLQDPKTLVVLSRYDRYLDGSTEIIGGKDNVNGSSSDAWIFRAPLPPFESTIQCGVIGCDTLLAQRAAEGGLTVLNPCLTIRAIHWHPSQERNNQTSEGLNYWYSPGYKGDGVPPCTWPV